MKGIFNLFVYLLAILPAVSVVSCSDEPDSTVNYGKMRLGKMNLTGAKRLALKTGDSGSRAIDGEYLSAGLYKIDENGNIAAVGVYFTTDSLGNKLDKEYALKVVPRRLFNLTRDFALAYDCDYYDSDGDAVVDRWMSEGDRTGDAEHWVRQSVPFRNLLIRLTDGKIWCIDNIMDKLRVGDQYRANAWQQDKKGNLYVDMKYKFNLNNQEASLEQVTPYESGDFHISDNDVLWEFGGSEARLYWPQKGYQIISRYDIPSLVYGQDNSTHYFNSNDEEVTSNDNWEYYYKTGYYPSSVWVNNNENPGILVFGRFRYSGKAYSKAPFEWAYNHMPDDIARYYDITIGDTPGSATLADPIILKKEFAKLLVHDNQSEIYMRPRNSEEDKSNTFVGDGYILFRDSDNNLSKIDLKKREWTIVKTLENGVDFDGGEYAGRAWSMLWDDNNGSVKFYWLDINTLEDGYVVADVTIPEWMYSYGFTAKDGYAHFGGTNPSNFNQEDIYIDLLTGVATTSVVAAEFSFDIIISLN